MPIRYRFALAFSFFYSLHVFSQNPVDSIQKPVIQIEGFLDTYFRYSPEQQVSQSYEFFVNHANQGSFSLNYAQIKLGVSHSGFRGNLALHGGNYVSANYSQEPSQLRSIAEANAGMALDSKSKWWIDAGIFESYIGFESVKSIDNPTLGRSLIAEASPYFMTGAQLSFRPNPNWYFALIASNGWQRIQPVVNSSILSGGSQVQWTPDEETVLNWSTFVGSEYPDDARRLRYFNNLYLKFKLSDKSGMIVGVDMGAEEGSSQKSDYNFWLGSSVIFRTELTEKWATAARLEYFDDRQGIVMASSSLNEFTTGSGSLNIDYSPRDEVALRLEGRLLLSETELFRIAPFEYNKHSFFILASLAIKFAK